HHAWRSHLGVHAHRETRWRDRHRAGRLVHEHAAVRARRADGRQPVGVRLWRSRRPLCQDAAAHPEEADDKEDWLSCRKLHDISPARILTKSTRALYLEP